VPVIKMMSPYVFLHCVVVTCSDILETVCSSRMSEHPTVIWSRNPKNNQNFKH